MVEPDGVMNGPAWPTDWQTGWVTWRYSDMSGKPLEASVPGAAINLSLSVLRATSAATHTTIFSTPFDVPLVDGRPSGPRVVVNSAGVPCIEMPLSTDPDVQPLPLYLHARESWGEHYLMRRLVLPEHTLDSPLWLTGDASDVAEQPGVVSKLIWKVPTEASGPPLNADVGDWVLYQDTAVIKEITTL